MNTVHVHSEGNTAALAQTKALARPCVMLDLGGNALGMSSSALIQVANRASS